MGQKIFESLLIISIEYNLVLNTNIVVDYIGKNLTELSELLILRVSNSMYVIMYLF